MRRKHKKNESIKDKDKNQFVYLLSAMHFDDLFRGNVPHVLERIFVDNLDDHRDFEACRSVSRLWRSYFEVQFDRRKKTKAKIASRKLTSDWLKRDFNRRKINVDQDFEVGYRVSFVDAIDEDVIVMLTKHGQRKCVLLRFDPETLRVSCRSDVDFVSAVVNVDVSDGFVFIFLHNEPAAVFNRATLQRSRIDVQGLKSFKHFGSTSFSLLKKPENDDFHLRRLELEHEKILRYRSVPQANPHQRCGQRHRFWAVDESHVALGCKHGFVQLFDHAKNELCWSHKATSFNMDEVVESPFLQSDFVVFAFAIHLQNSKTEHQIFVFRRKWGDLKKRFVVQSSHKIFLASSDNRIVIGQKDENSNCDLIITVYEAKSNIERIFRTEVSSGFQRPVLLGADGRILLLQSMVGTAGQRTGELKIFDLDAKNVVGSERIVSDLMYSGPLNKKLVSVTQDSFIAQTRDGLYNISMQ